MITDSINVFVCINGTQPITKLGKMGTFAIMPQGIQYNPFLSRFIYSLFNPVVMFYVIFCLCF